MKEYTEAEILEDVECPAWADEFGNGGIRYRLTREEWGWVAFVRGNYSIANYIDNSTDDNGITTFEPFEFSGALDNDCEGAGKAVCLSDDTALQKIFFYGYAENREED